MRYSARRWAAGLLFGLAVSAPSLVQAYDVDTHFYATYSMARYAGLTHDVAAYIASATQWMDESWVSSPFWPPVGGLDVKIRRLFHFAGTEKAGKFKAETFAGLKFVTKTEPNHPIANEMITEGLEKGWLLEAATGLHTLEDSYAHAGTIAQVGHLPDGHWPDRPFDAPEKYWQMTATVFKAMVAFRELLPESAVDCRLIDRVASAIPNCRLDAVALARGYAANPLIKATVEHNPLLTVEYTRPTVEFLLRHAKEVGYIYPNIDLEAWMAKELRYTEGRDARTALKSAFMRLLAFEELKAKEAKNPHFAILNKVRLLKDTGFGSADDPDYWASWDKGAFMDRIVEELAQGYIPRKLDLYNRFEAEKECEIRQREMAIRIRGMRTLVQKLYGVNLHFQGSNAKREYEAVGGTAPETPLPEIRVTFAKADRRAFEDMIVHYLFPTATSAKNFKSVLFDSLTLGLASPYYDIYKTRLVARDEDLYYQKPALFQKWKGQGRFKTLLKPGDVGRLMPGAADANASSSSAAGLFYAPAVSTTLN